MALLIAGSTARLRYVAEVRDGSGAISTGSNIKLKVRDATADTWYTGADWGDETELTATAFVAGAWYYDLPIPASAAGHLIEWVFYNETDGTVVCTDGGQVLPASPLAIMADTALRWVKAAVAGNVVYEKATGLFTLRDDDGITELGQLLESETASEKSRQIYEVSSSPSASPSLSPSASSSRSPSVSPSVSSSMSPSISESASESISPSVSESASESASPSE